MHSEFVAMVLHNGAKNLRSGISICLTISRDILEELRFHLKILTGEFEKQQITIIHLFYFGSFQTTAEFFENSDSRLFSVNMYI